MQSHQATYSESEHHGDTKAVVTDIKQTGLTGETIEHLVKSSNESIREFGMAMHHSKYGEIICQLGPMWKLIELAELKEGYDELHEHGHSAVASFIGSGAGIVAETATFMGGAVLTTAGVAAIAEAPPIGATAMASGILLMRESENVGKITRHHVPIIVDSTLDKFSDLYSSAAQFVKDAYQKFSGSADFAGKKYGDIESVMVDLGYKEHVRELYKFLDQDQQLVYSAVTRDIFTDYFKFNQDKSIKAEAPPAKYGTLTQNAKPVDVKQDIDKIRGKLLREPGDKNPSGQLETALREQNKKLKTCLTQLTKEANQHAGSVASRRLPVQSDPVKSAHEFCEVLNATSQGVALVSRLTGNHRLAQQVTMSAMGVSQVVMGVAQIAKSGFAAGPVGMIFGGMNALVSCFGSDGGDSGMQAMAEQLAIISQQIHALHEDMLLQFGKVFTALGIINANIIEGFRQLHEDQVNILTNVIKLQKSVSDLQDSVNALGHKIDSLGSDLQGYVLEDDRKQLQLTLNDIREKSKRPFNRLKLHPQAMAAFRTFNEELTAKKLNAEKALSAEISKSLTAKIGSAEANTGLLLNFVKNVLGLKVTQPIADPVQWQKTADLLMEMVEKTSQEKRDMEVIGEQDYKDFKYLKEIGDNWLAVIEQFKTRPDKSSKLAELFRRYRSQVISFVSLIEKEIERAEQENRLLKPKFQGQDELKKQEGFKFEFKRNNYFITLTADGSACKGFNNGPRAMGYDLYGARWVAHIANRQKEIEEKLAKYKSAVSLYMSGYEKVDHAVSFYKPSEFRYSSSVFISSETSPDTMPLLPLPDVNYERFLEIPECYITAEIFGLGKIKHTYKFCTEKEKKPRWYLPRTGAQQGDESPEKTVEVFIYKLQFQMSGQKDPIIIREYKIKCKLLDYLNPAEAAWHAYMGGTYPTSGSNSSHEYGSTSSSNGDYWVRHDCAVPSIAAQPGLRDSLDLSKISPSFSATEATTEMVSIKVRQKKAELRHVMNERIIQQLESLDSRNVIAAALTELDASAKVLIAFLSILFRDKFERPPALWTREEIVGFVKGYQNQDVYLSHQLETNLVILDSVEKLLLNQLNSQAEIAYTPVKATLVKLAHFMNVYEKHVLKDSELAAREKAEANREVAMYGAAQATLVIQSELLNSGHVDAAMHLSQLLARSGFGLFSILPPEAGGQAQAGYARHRLFPIPSLASSEMAEEDEMDEKKVRTTGYGSQ